MNPPVHLFPARHNEFTNSSLSSFIFQKIVKGVKLTCGDQPSASMFSSSEGISRVSESDSRLGFADPASTSPSDDKFRAVVPEDVPNKC